MGKITERDIQDLEDRLSKEVAKSDSDIKRITFLKATINWYRKMLELKEPHDHTEV